MSREATRLTRNGRSSKLSWVHEFSICPLSHYVHTKFPVKERRGSRRELVNGIVSTVNCIYNKKISIYFGQSEALALMMGKEHDELFLLCGE